MTETETDDIAGLDDLGQVILFTCRTRQYEVAALAHKQGIEDPDTLPHERLEMEADWARHLAEAKDYALQRDDAIDRHLAKRLTGSKKRYERLKESGICVYCKTAEAIPGRVWCSPCTAKEKQRRVDRIALGVCSSCGKARPERRFATGRLVKHCTVCLERGRAR